MKKKAIKGILIIMMLAMGYSSYATSTNTNENVKPLKVNKDWEKTKLENVFYTKNEEKGTVNLYIINKQNNVVEFTDLQGVGKLEYQKPILLFKGNKIGCVNSNGEIIRPIENDYISDFYNDEAVIKKDKVGVINSIGKEVIPLIYEEVHIGEDKKYIVKKDGVFYLYNLENLEKLDVDYIYKVSSNLFVFSKNEKFGVMSIENKIVVPNEFDEISMRIDKTFIGMKGESFAIYTLQDNKQISENFDYIEQVGVNEYIGGTFSHAKYAFLSETIKTDEKYENVMKINDKVYIGEISNNSFEVINLDENKIQNMSKSDVVKYIELIEKEKE